MAGKSQPGSTFTIRFNPASAVDDDEDELYNFGTTRPKKEVLQFERRSASPQPNPDGTANPVEVSDAVAAATGAGGEQMLASHPGTLWKSPLHAVRSAPGSEATSPVSPLKTNTPSENDKSVLTRDVRGPGVPKDESQRSIFSELRERIVNQSREMLPKRLNKTGSADTAKIVMTPAEDDKSTVEKEMVVQGHSRPGSDGGEAIAKEILRAGSTECINGDWEKPSVVDDSSVKKSSSAGQISSKQDSGIDSEHQSPNDVNTSHLFSADVVSMSELLSSKSRESPDIDDTVIASDASASLKLVAGHQKPEHLSRMKRAKSSLRIPAFLKTQRTLAIFVLFLSLVLLPLPPFLSGFLAGSFFVAFIAIVLYNCFLAPVRVKEIPPLQDLKALPSLQIPEMKESKNTEGLFKGWMNELGDYDVDNYHINQTHSVLVTLEGSTMRLQTPKQGIAKRAMWDESIPSTVSFVRQKHYDLRGCQVSLLPPDLIEKRLWSKKYPICIEVSKRPVAETQDRISRELAKRNSLPQFEGESTDLDPKSSPVLGARVTKAPSTVKSIKHLFLFARSSREKEEWYRRFVAATAETPWPTRMSDLLQKKSASSPSLVKSHARNGSTSLNEQQVHQHKRHGSTDSQCSNLSCETLPSPEADYARLAPEKNLLEYMNYMGKIMPASESGAKTSASSAELCDPQLLWLNAIISRCFLDFLREKYWTNKIRHKIQKKLDKMHVPHFIDQLTVTGIELGPQVPVICQASKPYLDDRGFWVDMNVSYGGGFGITMETKCNLMKLKSAPSVVKEEKLDAGKRSGALFSDEEDSAESTTDEEAVEENSTEDANSDRRSEPMSKKLLKFVDKISKSRYFQQATDYHYVKKAMEEVSNTRLVLNVEMKAVSGILAVNIPPPPTNRIWYGFRGNPNLVLSAKPRVGEREVSLSHITDWIEKKLAIEFQRVFVMPNMDDIPIPLMCEHLPSSQVTTATV